MSESVRGSNNQFVVGFASAALLTAAIVLVAQSVEFAVERPQPEAFIQFLTAARFSFVDVFGVVVWILLVGLIIAAVQWGPRVR